MANYSSIAWGAGQGSLIQGLSNSISPAHPEVGFGLMVMTAVFVGYYATRKWALPNMKDSVWTPVAITMILMAVHWLVMLCFVVL